MSHLISWLLQLWVAAWRADERLHGPSRRRWPWVGFWVGVVLLVVVWWLEASGVLPW
jgi:hypothetical protein